MKTTLISILMMFAALALCAVAASASEDAGAASGPVPAWMIDAGAEVPAVGPTEPAMPVVTPETAEADPIGAVERLLGHVRAGEWRYAAAIALVLLMFLANAIKIREHKWFKGDRGGCILVMLLALGGAVSAALLSPVPLDWRLVLGAIGVCWSAVGGVQWFKRLIWPKDTGEAI